MTKRVRTDLALVIAAQGYSQAEAAEHATILIDNWWWWLQCDPDGDPVSARNGWDPRIIRLLDESLETTP